MRSFSLYSVRSIVQTGPFFSCFFGLSLDSECLAGGGRGLGARVAAGETTLCAVLAFFMGL